jgi:hypothetical protein
MVRQALKRTNNEITLDFLTPNFKYVESKVQKYDTCTRYPKTCTFAKSLCLFAITILPSHYALESKKPVHSGPTMPLNQSSTNLAIRRAEAQQCSMLVAKKGER